MRIAQIMLAKQFGGAERSFVDLCAELVARGHDVLAICEARGAALPMLRRIAGLTICPVRVWGAWDPLARRAIARALRAHRSVVVQCHLARAAHLGGHAARRLDLPTLAKTHNYVDLRYYRAIDRLVPTTRSQERYLIEHGIAPTRLTRIPNFTRLPRAAARPLDTGAPRVVALGRLVEKKGFDVLLDALAIVARDARPLALTIAGDGPQRAALEARARSLPATIAVHFTGWRDDVATLFASSDLFVLPSRDEPFGIVVLEAMAAGVPIIATQTAGPLEILNATTAVFVPIGDVQALAQAIGQCLDDRSAAKARAAQAALVYEMTYAAAAVVPKYEALYTHMIETSKVRTNRFGLG
jgi:glycosyltransferase involved in cell wall biosynthesis